MPTLTPPASPSPAPQSAQPAQTPGPVAWSPDPPRGVILRDFPIRPAQLSGGLRWLGRTFLSTNGWTAEGGPPDVPKMVLVGYPHTSNWDLPYMLASAWTFGFWPSWFGKDSLFNGPFGGMMRSLKGVSVNRSSAHNVVEQLVQRFVEHDEITLLVPVEGTRSYKDHWRSGFYYIALGAGVPIVLTHLNYGGKRTGILGMIYPSGDVNADMDAIRAHYAEMGATGKFPKLANPIRLKDEVAGRDI